MSALFNSADCGPINGLQALTKNLDRDRGLQQDHFSGGSRASSSRQNFHTPSETAQSTRFAQEASQFFSNAQASSSSQTLQPRPFDLSALNSALPNLVPQNRSQSQGLKNSPWIQATPTWALDFNVVGYTDSSIQAPSASINATEPWHSEFSSINSSAPPIASPSQMQSPYMGHTWSQPSWPMQQQAPIMSPLTREPAIVAPEWAAQFASVDQQSVLENPSQSKASSPSVTVDDLSATAELLLSSMKHENSAKFQNSEFMGLMRRIRDRKVVVEGNDMVESDTRTSYIGREGNGGWQDEFAESYSSHSEDKARVRAVQFTDEDEVMSLDPRPSVVPGRRPPINFNVAPGYYESMAAITGLPVSSIDETLQHELQEHNFDAVQEHANDLDTLLEGGNAETPALLGKDYLLNNTQYNGEEQYAEWGRMQAEWDALEATTTGLVQNRNEESYEFQVTNPYLEATRQHMMHSVNRTLPYQNVLQTEAAVQRDLRSASAWFDLGVKQQENEREDKAIQALSRATELDPTFSAAWLALAVSHTNENDRNSALDAISQWINANVAYREVVDAHRNLNAESIGLAKKENSTGIFARQNELVQCLMTMARMSLDGQIDADIQIALGVLLNMSEEYDKAGDCFQTALAVRPDDWLLYNRIGATLANSGHAYEALDYYYRALELNPSYIRARFNLGISCINLKMFEEAAEHILDALVLQENDATPDAGGSSAGLSSSSLWDSLRTTCMHLKRQELVELCEKKDLDGFRLNFSGRISHMF